MHKVLLQVSLLEFYYYANNPGYLLDATGYRLHMGILPTVSIFSFLLK